MYVLSAPNLSAITQIRHGFFGRPGGVSADLYAALNCGLGSGDKQPDVIENRRRVAAALGTDTLVTLRQTHSATAIPVHGCDCAAFTANPPPGAGDRPEGDALATATPGVALGILTADCAPILLADANARVIGAAHAGWKGAAGGVIEAAIAAMEEMGATRRHIRAAIGPCIGQDNYEVGAEFMARFTEADRENSRYFVSADRGGHFRFDLERYVADRLTKAGLHSVAPLHRCTYADSENFFSFRRATHRGETHYGRQVSAIVLR